MVSIMDGPTTHSTGAAIAWLSSARLECLFQFFAARLIRALGALILETIMNSFPILLADNDPDYLDILKESLEGVGFRVIVASNPKEARNILEHKPISLAIIDLRLVNDADDRDMSGLLLAKLSNPDIPKIILSRYPTFKTVRSALGSNLKGLPAAVDFIDKSEGVEALLKSIENLSQRSIGNSARFDKLPDIKESLIERPKPSRPLRVFLCHSSDDKPSVRELYRRLKLDGISPWLDETDLLPGQEWEREIPKAVRNSDIVIVCLSRGSVSKKGYVQREIRIALDVADEQPEGTLFIIPLKLEECVIPERLGKWQWVNYFEEGAYERLMHSLKYRADELEANPKRSP
jgi:CheY-like chemotaxis protein